jgi:hypothetical protein
MTAPVDLARGEKLVELATGWQLWKVDGRAFWMRPIKTYNAAAERVAPGFEILGDARGTA